MGLVQKVNKNSFSNVSYDSFMFIQNMSNQKFPSNINIMIIDDNPKDMDLFEDLLSTEGNLKFSLSKWTKGIDAIHYLENENKSSNKVMPNLIVIDLMMPEMNGKLILERLKELAQINKIAVIVYSAINNYQNLKDLSALKAAAFFQKPLNVEEFNYFITSN